MEPADYLEIWCTTQGLGIECDDVEVKDECEAAERLAAIWKLDDVPDDRTPRDSRATTGGTGEADSPRSPLTACDWLRSQGIFLDCGDL